MMAELERTVRWAEDVAGITVEDDQKLGIMEAFLDQETLSYMTAQTEHRQEEELHQQN